MATVVSQVSEPPQPATGGAGLDVKSAAAAPRLAKSSTSLDGSSSDASLRPPSLARSAAASHNSSVTATASAPNLARAATNGSIAESQPPQMRRSSSSMSHLINVALRASSRHIVKGPEKPSWNVAETATVAILREVLGGGGSGGAHAPTVDEIKVTRRAMEERMPKQPKEVSLKNVTVPRKHADFVPEDSHARLTGSVPCELIEYIGTDKASASDKVVLLLHGGAYIVGSPRSHRWASYACALKLRSRVLAVDYALAPENKYPSGLLDCLSAYLALITGGNNQASGVTKVDPKQVVFMGDSAGGGMCSALMLYLRDHNLPLPGAAVLMSPWTDLTLSDPFNQLHISDYLPNDSDAIMGSGSRLRYHEDVEGTYFYCTKREAVEDPYASPLFAPSLEGLPPILIQAGGAERPLGQCILLAFRLAAEKAQNVTLEVYEDQIHVFQLLADAHPASKRAISRFLAWIRNLPPVGKSAPPMSKFYKVTEQNLASGTNIDSITPVEPKVFAKELLDNCTELRKLEGQHLMSKRKSYGKIKQRTSRPIEVGDKLEDYEKACRVVLGVQA